MNNRYSKYAHIPEKIQICELFGSFEGFNDDGIVFEVKIGRKADETRINKNWKGNVYISTIIRNPEIIIKENGDDVQFIFFDNLIGTNISLMIDNLYNIRISANEDSECDYDIFFTQYYYCQNDVTSLDFWVRLFKP